MKILSRISFVLIPLALAAISCGGDDDEGDGGTGGSNAGGAGPGTGGDAPGMGGEAPGTGGDAPGVETRDITVNLTGFSQYIGKNFEVVLMTFGGTPKKAFHTKFEPLVDGTFTVEAKNIFATECYEVAMFSAQGPGTRCVPSDSGDPRWSHKNTETTCFKTGHDGTLTIDLAKVDFTEGEIDCSYFSSSNDVIDP